MSMLKIVYFIANLDKYLLQMTDTATGNGLDINDLTDFYIIEYI